MKKIVALVLSLVMVLGLATTAFGAAQYDLYTADGVKNNAADGSYYTLDFNKATKDKTTGEGTIAYYTVTYSDGTQSSLIFVDCARAEATHYLTLKDNEGVYKYLKTVEEYEYDAVGKAYANIGDECGQLDIDPDDDAYVTFNAKGVPSYWYAVDGGATFLLVDGELVEVTTAGNLVAHTWVVTAYNDDEEPITAECDDCDATAKLYETKLAAPAGATFEAAKVAGYWVVVDKAPVADDTTVESAQTFDAGIAMYVGMSVMAAAGSAVVLKKKD
ncbi:MAG: hypothetical protein IJE94_05720 [Oscillospiraceae bacterium]|nr:hypothetical protein [Oscillospiraceae bacterium]